MNWKTLILAAVAAGSTIAAAPSSAAAQDSRTKAGVGKWERTKDDRDRGDVLSQRDREARARAAREQVIREQERREREAHDRARDRDGERDRNRDRSDNDRGNGKGGPSFCRSGAGHPVHGRSWCVSKGFGLGNDRWGRAGWGNVQMGRSNRSGTIGGSTLSDILGRVVYGRLQDQSSRFGGGPLTGHWVSSSGGPLLLQVHAGRRPIAEFVDGNRDGRAEALYLNLGR